MSKIPSQRIRVPSDDYQKVVNGVAYHPHEGEWIEITTADLQVSDVQLAARLSRSQTELEAVQGEADQARRELDIIGPLYAEVHAFLARRILAWNWTEEQPRGAEAEPYVTWNAADPESGTPFVELDGSIAPFLRLSPTEQGYLLAVLQNGAPAARKNGSSGSPTMSSATPLTPTRSAPSRTSARSRTKAS